MAGAPYRPHRLRQFALPKFFRLCGNFLLISPNMLFEEGLLCEHDFKDKPQFDDSKVDFGSVIGYKTILF